MRTRLACVIVWLVSSAMAAGAGEITGTVSLVSDYDFRGVTQSAGDPALQASVDWAAGAGFDLGIWASNVDFGDCCDESIEVDLSGRWTGGDREQGVAFDIFGIWYAYPGGDGLDFPELSVGLAWRLLEARIWYSWDFAATGKSTTYVEANLSAPLPADLGLLLHAGYSFGDYWSVEVSGFEPYFDWSVGLERSFGHFDFSLRWIDGSDLAALDGAEGDVFSSAPRAVLGVGTTVPWG